LGNGTTIDSTGRVSFDTPGGVGAAAHRITFDATPASVAVGGATAPAGGAYLGGLGALTLGDVRTANAPLDVTAAAGRPVAPNALIDTGRGTIALAAGVNGEGTGNSSGTLRIAGGATVVSDNAGADAITLRGADLDISTGASPAVVGARRGVPAAGGV